MSKVQQAEGLANNRAHEPEQRSEILVKGKTCLDTKRTEIISVTSHKLNAIMPTAGTWKVPFRGKFGAYDANQRVVPPFSVQSLQKATVVQPPPRCHSANSKLSKTKTTFKR